MLGMVSALIVAVLALSAALPAPEVTAAEAALLARDDECGSGDDDGACALNALQHRGQRRTKVRTPPPPEEGDVAGPSGSDFGPGPSRERGDMHALNFLDRNDYREDAEAFLQEALAAEERVRSRLAAANGTMSDLELEDTSPNCDLAPMTYAEVLTKWSQFQKEWMSKLPEDVPPGTRRVFNDHIREAFPEILYQGNPVVVKNALKDIGWDAAAWEQQRLQERFGDLQFREMGFGYPAWLGDTVQIGMGGDAKGQPNTTSFTDYFAKNRSKDDLFLFLNEEMPTDEPRLPLQSENEAAFRLRDAMTPTPPFAYPSKSRLMLVAIDGRGSSHGFHEHTAVWQLQVQGYKMWHFMPPSTPFSMGVHVRGGTPLVKGKPFSHPNGCAFLKKVAMPAGATKCLAAPGDLVIMPANWVHSTCGLTEYTAGGGGWLHAEPPNRSGSPEQYLASVLAEIHQRRAADGWSEEFDLALNQLTDEENERRAGISPELRLLDRKLHPEDFDPRFGRLDRV